MTRVSRDGQYWLVLQCKRTRPVLYSIQYPVRAAAARERESYLARRGGRRALGRAVLNYCTVLYGAVIIMVNRLAMLQYSTLVYSSFTTFETRTSETSAQLFSCPLCFSLCFFFSFSFSSSLSLPLSSCLVEARLEAILLLHPCPLCSESSTITTICRYYRQRRRGGRG